MKRFVLIDKNFIYDILEFKLKIEKRNNMENFTFYAPTYFVFGKETENEAGKYIKKFGGSNVLIHYGKSSVIKSGLLDRVKKSLENENIKYIELGGVMPNPRSDLVYQGIDICKKNNIDFILAVGGGSVIDSSKAIAAGTVYDGDFWDFYSGKYVDNALPVGTVLTIAAAGSEGSPDSVITNIDGMNKRGASGEALRPKFSILNPELTQTLPEFQTACGLTDILAHLYERYLTNTKNVEVTDNLLEALMITIKKEGPKVIENPNDYEARANIMWAGMVAHNNVCGVGRSQDWLSHNIEHELSALYDCAHGAGLAVVMPAVFKYNMNHDVERFARVARNVWDVDKELSNEEAAIEGIEALKEFLKSIKMPLTFDELGAREEDIDYLAHNACYGNNKKDGLLNGFVTLTEEDVKEIYKNML